MTDSKRRSPYVTHTEFARFKARTREQLEEVAEEIERITAILEQLLSPTSGAVGAILSIGGSGMPGAITVDTQNESAAVQFVDDHQDPVPAPAGASVAYESSDPSVASIDASSGKITPQKVGTADIAAKLSGALEADGTTPIPDPAPVTVTVGPGPAAGAALVLSV